jgi:hypothetical protein
MPANTGGRTVVNHREIEALARSDDVTRWLMRCGERGVQEAKRLAPTSPAGHDDPETGQHLPSGHLRSSIRWEIGHDARGPYVDVIADADEALYVEFGTAPHVIRSTGDWPLRNRRTGQVFGPEVHHPGTEAQPFLRPALDVMERTD